MPETKTKPKAKPKNNFVTPVEALDPADPLGSVIFFGRSFQQDERDALLKASVSMTIEQVSQLSLRFIDENFTRLGTGIFEPNRTVAFEDLRLQVGTVEVNSESGNPALDVRCRPAIVRALKKRTGVKVMKGASPSDFVKSECREIGCKFVVQTSPKRNQVVRDHKRQKGDTQPPSSWTTFQRLAAEEGFAMFEAGNVLYFGKPTWLLDQTKNDAFLIDWDDNDDSTRPLTVPTCARSEDTTDDGVTISVALPYTYGIQFRPGKAVTLKGIPGFEGTYLISSVDIDLLSPVEGVQIIAGTPINPTASRTKGSKSGSTGGSSPSSRTTSSLRYLLKNKVGFQGDALEKAIAVAMAESGGDSQKYTKEDTSTKWAGYTGLFQIRALRTPKDFEGLDARRIKYQLLDAKYNADFTFDLTNKGANWSMFPSFADGTYRKFYKTGKDYQVQGWSVALPPPPPAAGAGAGAPSGSSTSTSTSTGSVGTGATGSKSASAFVAKALSQTGKAYVYGAEASGPNPSAFDCSELVEWAARMVGVYIPDGSSAQAAFCHTISVSQAAATRGALLFHPGHVAISLGNGSTIEAANPGFGVGIQSVSSRPDHFTSGGLIPGMRY